MIDALLQLGERLGRTGRGDRHRRCTAAAVGDRNEDQCIERHDAAPHQRGEVERLAALPRFLDFKKFMLSLMVKSPVELW